MSARLCGNLVVLACGTTRVGRTCWTVELHSMTHTRPLMGNTWLSGLLRHSSITNSSMVSFAQRYFHLLSYFLSLLLLSLACLSPAPLPLLPTVSRQADQHLCRLSLLPSPGILSTSNSLSCIMHITHTRKHIMHSKILQTTLTPFFFM